MVAHYGRRSTRLEALIRQFGVVAGGNPGIFLFQKKEKPSPVFGFGLMN